VNTIASICARGGSVGVPGKNLRPLGGKPLIVHTIKQALAAPSIDSVFVSTDSTEIAEVARSAGARVPFLRPAHLATADAPKVPVIEHLVAEVEQQGERVDVIVDLQPTSPLREVSDIEACVALLDASCDVVITGYESDKNPYFNMVEYVADGNVRLVKPLPLPVTGRQLAPKVFAMNGAIYVWHRHSLSKGLWGGRTRLYVMPVERSVDIDRPFDFQVAELLMHENAARTPY
jgi:CMP-N-acetylneuraminic acid synthetase